MFCGKRDLFRCDEGVLSFARASSPFLWRKDSNKSWDGQIGREVILFERIICHHFFTNKHAQTPSPERDNRRVSSPSCSVRRGISFNVECVICKAHKAHFACCAACKLTKCTFPSKKVTKCLRDSLFCCTFALGFFTMYISRQFARDVLLVRHPHTHT